MRRVSLFLSMLLAAALVAGCAGQSGSAPGFSAAGGKLKVATSFYPMYEFAHAVGGDRADVIYMVPAGTEPHDWEPTPRDVQTLNAAAVFIYNGADMEHWVPKTLKSLDNKQLVAVEASKGTELLNGGAEGIDPHVWLDPLNAVAQVQAIRDGLSQADPANKAAYDANAAAYIEKLKALDQEYKTALTGCGRKEFFTSHAAFGYLAHRYGIGQHAIMGLAPDAEPKPKELASIVADAKANGVKYIFFETLVSDKVAKTVAQEIGAQTLVLNPLEGLTDQEVKAGKDYFSVMRENLANLKTALECGK